MWKFELRGDQCEILDQCDVEIATESEDAEDVDTTIRLNWHDASSWQSANGPQWTDGDGNSPNGVPTNDVNVEIPTGPY